MQVDEPIGRWASDPSGRSNGRYHAMFAMKVVSKRTNDAEKSERARYFTIEEAELLMSLRHKNVVRGIFHTF